MPCGGLPGLLYPIFNFRTFFVEPYQVVKRCGDGWMVFAQRLLPDGQGIVQQIGRLLVLVLEHNNYM